MLPTAAQRISTRSAPACVTQPRVARYKVLFLFVTVALGSALSGQVAPERRRACRLGADQDAVLSGILPLSSKSDFSPIR